MRQIIHSTTTVRWKRLTDFPDYYISDNGLARKGSSLMIPKLRKGREHYYYYYIIVYGADKTRHRYDIHRLVWDYFGSEPHQPGYEVHHKDLNPANNNIGNLELKPRTDHRSLHKQQRKQAKADFTTSKYCGL
jgi:hypothetical protein